jgi:predicted dithiol-disulfide oxidoreductase (DUF899 family)
MAAKQKKNDRSALAKALVRDEIGMKNHIEKVAAKRRKLPAGEPVAQDYVFAEGPGRPVKLSQLFDKGKDELIIYHYMFAPKDKKPCPMCTMWCDGYDRIEPYVRKRANFALVTKAPIEKLRKWARGRGWKNIRLLSSYGTTFNRDFGVEDKKENQLPAISVFTKDKKGTVRHFYQKSALLDSRNYRGIDQLTPVWNLFDLLPSGRGDWYPNYEV